jgi:hypothetical protein
MKRYRLTLWIEHGDATGALNVDTYATTPGRAIDNALDRYRLPATAVIGWQQITKHTTIEREKH